MRVSIGMTLQLDLDGLCPHSLQLRNEMHDVVSEGQISPEIADSDPICRRPAEGISESHIEINQLSSVSVSIVTPETPLPRLPAILLRIMWSHARWMGCWITPRGLSHRYLKNAGLD